MQWLTRPALFATAAAVLCCHAASAAAQNRNAAAEPPPKEQVGFSTRDGVQLKADFYPGTLEKESVPVVLIHMYEGNRRDFQTLAEYLQSQGHAVLVPDLRGHGESIHVEGDPNRRLDARRLTTAELEAMVGADLEACKGFLMEKHNAGKLNIDRLVVVGAEMGAVVGLQWARVDWSWPVLSSGKQGQDVKAVAMISPPFTFRRLRVQDIPIPPGVGQRPSILIAVGKDDSRAEKEARKIYNLLERSRPDLMDAEPNKKDLFLVGVETRLQGTKILEEPNLGLHLQIAQFIKLRVGDRAGEFPWKERVNPLGK